MQRICYIQICNVLMVGTHVCNVVYIMHYVSCKADHSQLNTVAYIILVLVKLLVTMYWSSSQCFPQSA